MEKVKSFVIDKRLVAEAWKRVKANRGSAGVDNVGIDDFEAKLEDNLYKVWNRMSSGSYFPPPVKVVEIPKSDGKIRKLGVPTVGDRVAQMVVKMLLEPKVDPLFHEDSYGYRKGKSAHQALAKTRDRCWSCDGVIDLDIKGFFDNLSHELVMKAVRKHTDSPWMLMYIQRWLEAPTQDSAGISDKRTKGTPQGGVISPLLANLFMHYAFDLWMSREFPTIKFERYADDVVIHAVSESQAKFILNALHARMRDCGLALHPEKTKIVYCQDGKRKREYHNTNFDFLGYTFKRRSAKGPYGLFLSFLPAVSDKAVRKISEEIRSWRISSITHISMVDLANRINPKVRGWINYYGKFFKSILRNKVINLIVLGLERWVTRKYKSLKRRPKKARQWLAEIAKRDPKLFSHWSLLKNNDGTTGAV